MGKQMFFVLGPGPRNTTKWVVVLACSALMSTGCMGGCYSEADKVQTDPQTDCLSLYAGQGADDPTVCGSPQLSGTNNCADALTLPPERSGGDPVVVAAGAKIFYGLGPVPPGIIASSPTNGVESYAIAATVGTSPVTITVVTHHD
jgi:hypothetical protein